MFLSTVAAIVGIAGSVYSISQNSKGKSGPGASAAQTAADPFAPYRSDLGAQYSAALQPGSNVNPSSLPGYSSWMTGVLQPALQATQGADAASGKSYSGAESQDLLQTAQKGYYGFMTDYMNRLAQGSGAVNNPATAAGLGLQQGNLNAQGVMQGVGGLTQGLSSLAGQNSGQSYQAGGGYGAVPGGYVGPDGQNYNNPSAYTAPSGSYVDPGWSGASGMGG